MSSQTKMSEKSSLSPLMVYIYNERRGGLDANK